MSANSLLFLLGNAALIYNVHTTLCLSSLKSYLFERPWY